MAEHSSQKAAKHTKIKMSTANNNTSGQTDFSAKEYWTWETRDERWGSFLAEIRTRLSMAQRQVSTKQALARELVTVHNRDVLASNLATMGDLADLEATVTDAFVTKLLTNLMLKVLQKKQRKKNQSNPKKISKQLLTN